MKQLDFDVEAYYASEIDSNALLLTWSHFGSEINQLGSVIDIDQTTLDRIGPINLLMGGSPCSDLSCVNHRKKGLYGNDYQNNKQLFIKTKFILNKFTIIRCNRYRSAIF